MVDTLIRHIIMVLIIWQVVRCYQHWVLAQASHKRLARQAETGPAGPSVQGLDPETGVCAV